MPNGAFPLGQDTRANRTRHTSSSRRRGPCQRHECLRGAPSPSQRLCVCATRLTTPAYRPRGGRVGRGVPGRRWAGCVKLAGRLGPEGFAGLSVSGAPDAPASFVWGLRETVRVWCGRGGRFVGTLPWKVRLHVGTRHAYDAASLSLPRVTHDLSQTHDACGEPRSDTFRDGDTMYFWPLS